MCVSLAVFLMVLTGCPPRQDANERVDVTPKLPQCVKLYLDLHGKQFWRAIKTPLSEGEVVEQNPSQKYRYQVCGRSAFGWRPLGTAKCDVSGEHIIAYRGELYEGLVKSAVEVSEHCIDDPISGACEEWNCEYFFKRTPYPPTCTALATRRVGTCDAMWTP